MPNTPAANTATPNTSGNWFNDVTSNLLSLVDQGARVYSTLNNKTQGAASEVSRQQTQGAAITSTGTTQDGTTYFGFTKNQWLLLGGGAALVSLIILLRRR